MKAAAIHEGVLRIEERPDPSPGPGEIVVAVRAAGVNRADLLQRAERYPAPPGEPSDVPGLELAGEVAAVGSGALRFRAGDRVMALLGGGAHAERAVIHERLALPVPDGIEWPAAGGFVEVFATAHDALFTQAGLALGERLLVTGAAGGVGIAAVQLAREAGARVVASARNERLRPRIAALGVEACAPDDVAGEFDVVLELVGGEELARDVERLATGGRLVVIGTGAGSRAEVDFAQLMRRRARISASTLRARPLEEKARVVRRLERHVLPHLAAGRIEVPVEAVFPLAEAQAAYDRFAAGGKLGKIVLAP